MRKLLGGRKAVRALAQAGKTGDISFRDVEGEEWFAQGLSKTSPGYVDFQTADGLRMTVRPANLVREMGLRIPMGKTPLVNEKGDSGEAAGAALMRYQRELATDQVAQAIAENKKLHNETLEELGLSNGDARIYTPEEQELLASLGL